MYWITSSRRSCSKSTSMSGGSLRSFERNRPNSSLVRLGIHFGDPERITDHRIGGRTAALAENRFAARVLDDVVDGQEEGLVTQFGNEFEFFFGLGRVPFPEHRRGSVSPIRLRSVPADAAPASCSPERFLPDTHSAILRGKNCTTRRCAAFLRAVPADRFAPASRAGAGGVPRSAAARGRLWPPARRAGLRSTCPAARGGRARACARRRRQ